MRSSAERCPSEVRSSVASRKSAMQELATAD